MGEVVRLYRCKSLQSRRKAVSALDSMAATEVLRTTLHGDLGKLRDQLPVPIHFSSDWGGYTLELGNTVSELPGLLGDIMRFGSDVQVLAPPALRSKVQKSFLEAAARYVG